MTTTMTEETQRQSSSQLPISLLDYGAGNVRSVYNAIVACGYSNVQLITTPAQILEAKVIIFPGVGSYHSAMTVLKERGYDVALKEYLANGDRPYLGICLGMQTLFEGSDEIMHHNNGHDKGKVEEEDKDELPGLGIIPGRVIKFDATIRSVPHIGWNGVILHKQSPAMKYLYPTPSSITTTTATTTAATTLLGSEVYFVHSYYAPIIDDTDSSNTSSSSSFANTSWILTSTTYEGQAYISSIQKGSIVATQFHPEKSGIVGLNFLRGFLESVEDGTLNQTSPLPINDNNNNNNNAQQKTQLVKRVVVALDVRSNDFGDLVVTKGDQYDVREKTTTIDEDGNNGGGSGSNGGGGERMVGRGGVRNLGKPVQLASRYYTEGADEIAFLNITSYRSGVIDDMPMLQVLEESSKSIFVPLTVGGGIRSYTDEASGTVYSAIEVASRYFRAGADKVSIGSDAVYAAEEYVTSNGVKTGLTSIETISSVYGVQAVVISIDPRRVYVSSPDDVLPEGHVVVELSNTNGPLGPNGENYCWYQCTVSGGRTNRPICAVTVARAVEALGAGEIMLNCIDMDGQCAGYDHALMNAVSNAVSIPVIASSGAGNEQHFVDVFENTKVRAALAAGMFHRREVEIGSVKRRMEEAGIRARIF